MVVEDDPDTQFLVEAVLSEDDRVCVAVVAASAEDEAAPRLKEVAPIAKIILFTAHAELRHSAADEPAIAFLLKTDISQLLRLAQRLTGLGPQTD